MFLFSTAFLWTVLSSQAIANPGWSMTKRGLFNVDTGMAGAVRAHPDALLPLRISPAMLSIVPRYQVGVSGYMDDNLDNGFAIGAVDSTQGPVSLGVLFVQNQISSGLDTDQLPGWKRPDEEFETEAVDSIMGGSLAISFLNRLWGLGVGVFYHGYKTDIAQTTNAFEVNLSSAWKMAEQLSFTMGVTDSFDMSDGRAFEAGMRWGILEVGDGGPPWQDCRSVSDQKIYRSSGGLSVDYKGSLNGDASGDYWATGFDFPMSCNVNLRGGFQQRISEERRVYGLGLSWDNTQFNIGYDLQLSPVGDAVEQRHLIGLRFRLAPWNNVPRPHL